VKRLVEALVAARGWSIWWDTALRPGEQFDDTIRQVVEQARCVVVVWSQQSVTSRWVVAEVSEGWERQALVPVIIEECEPPLPFRQTQAADLKDWRGTTRAPAFLALVDSIERVLATQAPPQADELEARAARVRAHRRRVMRRRLAAAAAALAVVALGVWADVIFGVRRAADHLAAQADALRQQVLAREEGEEHRMWVSVLLENDERMDRLELANLLGTEAFRRAHTEHTEATLRALLLMSPWSDAGLEIEHEVSALAFSADGRFVVAGGGPDDTLVWDWRANKVSARITHGGMNGQDKWIDASGRESILRGPFVLDVSPKDAVIATAGPDHDAALWDLESGREIARFAHEDTVTAVRFARSGEVLATLTEDGVVHVWDVASRRELRQMPQGSASDWIGVSPTGRYVASVAEDHKARVWQLASGELSATLEPDGPIDAATFSPDEQTIATFGEDAETTVFWTLPAGTREWQIPKASNGVVFGPEQSTIVIGEPGTVEKEGTDSKLTWWERGQQEASHSASLEWFVGRMATSADHARLVTSDAEMARVWDARTGHELRQMAYLGWLTAVAISPDGRYFASTGRDIDLNTLIEVTEVWPDDPVAASCARVHRNLTPDEWREYVGESEGYRKTCPGLTEEQSEP